MALLRSILLLAIVQTSASCSSAGAQAIHVVPPRIRPVLVKSGQQHARPQRTGASVVEESLHARGVRFGTDGSMVSLYAFVSDQLTRIPAEQAQPGDVLFFDTGEGCGGHAGLVETSEGTGRIGFREWRDGSTRHSFVTPTAPLYRRDGNGRILNTFLRPKRPDDGPETRYFAGDMLCAVYRANP